MNFIIIQEKKSPICFKSLLIQSTKILRHQCTEKRVRQKKEKVVLVGKASKLKLGKRKKVREQ